MEQSVPQGWPWQGGGGHVTAPVTQVPAAVHFIGSAMPGGVQASPHNLPVQGVPPEPPVPPAPLLVPKGRSSLVPHAATAATAPSKASQVFRFIAA